MEEIDDEFFVQVAERAHRVGRTRLDHDHTFDERRKGAIEVGKLAGRAGALAAMPSDRRAAVVATMRKLEYEWPFSLVRNDAPIAEWRRLAAPTLLISGEKTTFALHRLVDLLRRSLPTCDLVSISGAGHMSPLTHPDEVNSAIRRHIERHPDCEA